MYSKKYICRIIIGVLKVLKIHKTRILEPPLRRSPKNQPNTMSFNQNIWCCDRDYTVHTSNIMTSTVNPILQHVLQSRLARRNRLRP